jgi:glutamyl endopeptidase
MPPSGPHTPVTNKTTEAAPLIQPVSAPSNLGTKGGTATPNANGVESIPRPESMPDMSAAGPQQAPDTSMLLDIGLASFRRPEEAREVFETIHGPKDDRVRIKDTGKFPWRVHASLLITAADNSPWIGTAWFIGPRTLVTAGHCVYITNSDVPGRNGWVKSIRVMPGRDASTLPFGFVNADKFWTVKGWTDSGNENFDYGAIVIPENLGDQVGWFGIGVYADTDLTATVGNISGYPGDKRDPSGTQWYDTRQIASVNPSKVFYDIDTMGGQSGSAVYRIIDGKHIGIAVHAYGGATHNSGTRINNAVYDNLTAWNQ